MSAAFDADLTACADLVRRADPARFQAAMAAPVAARVVLFPVYAFNVEVARAPWVTQEPMIAEMRLQWWVEALEEIRAGNAVRRHEVVSRLAQVLDAEGAALLIDLIEARRWDIERAPFEDEADFIRYIEATSGNLIRAAARALGPAEEDVLCDAGFALGLSNWFRAMPALEAAGRKPLPDGRPEAVRNLAGEGLRRLARARAARAHVSSAAAPALFPLWETGPVLRAAMRRPASVAEGTLDLAPVRSRLGLMLRVMSGRW
ncbi:squalene/phytoene synthase [Roseovarius sp. A-2]|uniref:squalene/phytoene synthase family protein n=1 Tax=Roseovarius sp. A-2 TaxID=1570360 RepID=UPI0009B512FE|nr:squalene/phytoene synthase family protein [Roseovarius sp. A-2]GAW35115.1 squalene/phytoene synthase [Roseovarius sp. A-2]